MRSKNCESCLGKAGTSRTGGRQSSWESWEDSQGWSQSQSPRTPPRKTRAEDYGSPQGSASRFSVDVPDDFCQTRDYLDTREVYGLKFPKKIQPSAWAIKHQLAGREEPPSNCTRSVGRDGIITPCVHWLRAAMSR